MPTWLQFGVNFPPRRLQAPFKTPLDAPAWCPRRPKMRQEPPKSCPRAVQEATHRRLGAKTRHTAAPNSLQTSILDHFGHDLGGFWDHFGRSFWKGFGKFLIQLEPYSRNYPLAMLGGWLFWTRCLCCWLFSWVVIGRCKSWPGRMREAIKSASPPSVVHVAC